MSCRYTFTLRTLSIEDPTFLSSASSWLRTEVVCAVMSPAVCSPLPATKTRLPYVTQPENIGGLSPDGRSSVEVRLTISCVCGVDCAWATPNTPAPAAATDAKKDRIRDRRDACSVTSI